ncbi:MAG: ATP-binding protein [Chthoniobacterales bacterium]
MGLATQTRDKAQRNDSQATTRRHAKTSPHNGRTSPAHNATQDREYLTLAARATNDAIRVWDVANGGLSWPQGLDSLLGYDESIVSNEIDFWQRHLHPDDRTRTTGSVRDALSQERCEHWSGEYRFRQVDGTYLLLLERALIVRDAAGKAVSWVGSLMDITARKQLQDQLCRSQRMEAFGQLAGGVAHDFNNFLTTILGYSDMLLSELSVKGSLAKHIGEIKSAASRASALTAQLLAFSRKHPLAPCVLEVNSLITNLERSCLRLVGENISVQCELHRLPDGAHIRVDRGEITQIILNLVVNARDAMPNGGRICLTSGTMRADGNASIEVAPDQLAPGDYVSISVRDEGLGMSPEVKARLFEPFFTTKEYSRGSGLGLATSYGIVKQSGGDIRVESEPGCGTTVTIYMPRVAAQVASYKKSNGHKPPTGNETVLVVEDDIGVRHLTLRALRSLGYTVIEAANGDDAQRLFASHGDRKIDLVITDIVMPQMSGDHFAAWLRKIRPQTKVIFISGYLHESFNNPAGDADTFYLPKPFDPTQLALKVREALDGEG